MEQQLARELADARREIENLRHRLDVLETDARHQDLPPTALLDHSFFKRAFAVWGHYFVAGLIIGLPFYMLIMFLAFVAAGL